jgi:hypothetical protein
MSYFKLVVDADSVLSEYDIPNGLIESAPGHGVAAYAEDDSEGRMSFDGKWHRNAKQGFGTMIWRNGTRNRSYDRCICNHKTGAGCSELESTIVKY